MNGRGRGGLRRERPAGDARAACDLVGDPLGLALVAVVRLRHAPDRRGRLRRGGCEHARHRATSLQTLLGDGAAEALRLRRHRPEPPERLRAPAKLPLVPVREGGQARLERSRELARLLRGQSPHDELVHDDLEPRRHRSDSSSESVSGRSAFAYSMRAACSTCSGVIGVPVLRRGERRREGDRPDRPARDVERRDRVRVDAVERRLAGKPRRQISARCARVRERELHDEAQPAQERAVDVRAQVRGQDREPAVRLHPLQQVRDLEVRVAVVAVA